VWTIVAAALAAATLAVLAIVLLTRPGTRAKRAQGAGDAAPGPTIRVETTRLGRILVDARGRTLYLFAKDRAGRSACVGGCTRVWPPALANGRMELGPGVRAAKVTTMRRRDGRRQLVYNGHPLYSLISDTAPGQASGQGFEGTWFVVSPAGRAIVPRGAKAPAGY
jgi:predicted lipoprotein with Yx(FWY)xxD motif